MVLGVVRWSLVCENDYLEKDDKRLPEARRKDDVEGDDFSNLPRHAPVWRAIELPEKSHNMHMYAHQEFGSRVNSHRKEKRNNGKYITPCSLRMVW
jgi:hypothetical protein